jgi:hypothetical protein
MEVSTDASIAAIFAKKNRAKNKSREGLRMRVNHNNLCLVLRLTVGSGISEFEGLIITIVLNLPHVVT